MAAWLKNKNLIVVFIAVSLFVLHEYLGLLNNSLTNSYLDDVLFFPVVFGVTFFIHQKVYSVKVSRWFWVVLSICLAIVVEEVYPVLSKSFTRDNYDYLAYWLGLLIFLWQSSNL